MKILLTGAAGFIGRNVAAKLTKQKHEVYSMIRPGASTQKLKCLQNTKKVECDLANLLHLNNFLNSNKFDAILHIGALRGGRNFDHDTFHKVNVQATKIIAECALRNNMKLTFCSSVGVFGAIPRDLPANNETKRNGDTYYHQTKIESEEIINSFVAKGLNAVIIRPSITYGAGDFGFPFTLTKLVDKKLLVLPKEEYKIHLTNVDLLADAFVNSIENDLKPGSAYIVADSNPVSIHQLANFISQKLRNEDYPKSRYIGLGLFRIGEKLATALRNDLWQSRFQLLSYSWFYSVENSFKDLELTGVETIPNFNKVIEGYLNQ